MRRALLKLWIKSHKLMDVLAQSFQSVNHLGEHHYCHHIDTGNDIKGSVLAPRSLNDVLEDNLDSPEV